MPSRPIVRPLRLNVSSEFLSPHRDAFACPTRAQTGFGGRVASLFILALGLAPTAGCLSNGFEESRSHASQDSGYKAKPKAVDDSKADVNTDAEWDSFGRGMRANQPVKKEEDGLKNFFVSPRAQEIERSLGVE